MAGRQGSEFLLNRWETVIRIDRQSGARILRELIGLKEIYASLALGPPLSRALFTFRGVLGLFDSRSTDRLSSKDAPFVKNPLPTSAFARKAATHKGNATE